MKKVFTILSLYAIMFSANAQKQIAYITTTAKMGGPGIDAVYDAIVAEGAVASPTWVVTQYDLPSAGTGIATTVAGSDMVFVSEFPGSAIAGWAQLMGAGKPMVFTKVFAYKAAALNFVPASTDYANTSVGTEGKDTTAIIITTSHEVFKGINATTGSLINILTPTVPSSGLGNVLTWVHPAGFSPGASAIIPLANLAPGNATVPYDATNQCILEIPVGTTLGTPPATGTPIITAARFIQIGINGVGFQTVNATGMKIITNACYYVMGQTVPTGIHNNKSENAFSVSPNPSDGVFTINFEHSSDDASVEVKSMDGRVVYNTTLQADDMNVNLSALTPGVYVVTYTSNKTAGTKKVVVK